MVYASGLEPDDFGHEGSNPSVGTNGDVVEWHTQRSKKPPVVMTMWVRIPPSPHSTLSLSAKLKLVMSVGHNGSMAVVRWLCR